MRQRFETRVIVGMLIWIGLISGGFLYARKSLEKSPQAFAQLAEYVGSQRHTVKLDLPDPMVLRLGDPVFLEGNDQFEPIGFVSRVDFNGQPTKILCYTDQAYVTFYGNAPNVSADDFLNYNDAAHSAEWVLKTMLPPSKRQEIGELLLDAYTKNQADIVAALRPVVEESLRQATQIIKADLKSALARRESQMREVGQKYQSQLIENELVPLLEQEIWPIVQRQSEGVATQVGQEIWQEVSVFRFGWRYVYDRSPLPDKNLTEREFNRFLDQKAMPILKSHVNDFVEVQKKIIQEVAKNEKVRQTFSAALKSVVEDREIQAIFSEVLQEVVIDNSRLKAALEQHWQGPEARYAIELASRRLEPTITEIGIALFGSPRQKITEEFARVLRHRILYKDSRWLTLVLSEDQANAAIGPESRNGQRVPFPDSIEVRYGAGDTMIPYAAAREQN